MKFQLFLSSFLEKNLEGVVITGTWNASDLRVTLLSGSWISTPETWNSTFNVTENDSVRNHVFSLRFQKSLSWKRL